ncbi:homeobox-1 [Actinidia rufa]|uniref:Homeobox-1 n=1 Tax=Actinidia rufa TaxID=165716 RepID=A0A7J0DIC9_9ERIC|nr:homeobox-1 [Actinidia rufa]
MEEGGSGGGSEVEKKKRPEGENKVKRKMKTASQLEILEKTYAVETYPSEALRADLSVQLGLSDRQLQMWFCHRRLKDRNTPPVKRPKKDSTVAAASSSGVGNEKVVGEVGNEHASGSGSGSSPFGHVESRQQRVALRTGAAIARIATDMPTLKRYYEPPQAISELRAIAFVEAQLGEPLREDGPILGMEFDPLPPGAFGAPIRQQKPVTRHFESNLYERTDAKPIKGAVRALHEYQFLPEQPTVRNDSFERAAPSHYYGSSTDVPSARSALSTGRSYMHGNEQVPPAYGFQGQTPSLSLLPHQGRQSHLLPSTSVEYDTVSQKTSVANIGTDAHFGAHPITALDNPFIPSERQVTNDEDIARLERKRKVCTQSEEARLAREVEAHEKRIRKELEKQDILRRKREEVRYQREQRRELERREKFLQKESIRAEKLRLKEELRREKEAARQKAASDRATARRIAKESMELIEDERLELMELAASSKGLPSILSLDGETLQNLELFKDKLIVFPPKSVNLKRPFAIKPWCDSEENTGNLFMDPRLLGEIHIALLRSIIKDIEDVARTPSTGLGTNQNCAANPGGGHPQIVQGAYAWGFDIRSWQRHLNPLTWPEILRQFALAAGYGPKLKKRSIEQAYIRDENEGDDGEDIISNLRNGAAAENAVAIMQERGFSNPSRSRHRVTPGTVKFAAFHVLSLEGSEGLTILEVAERIQGKIQIFKNGYLYGEDAEDVEHDDVERDEDSESDVAEDPEADDLGTEMKPNSETPCEANRFLAKTYPGDVKEASCDEVMRTPQVGPKNLAGSSPLMQSEGYKGVKSTSTSVDQFIDVARISNEAANLDQEDTVIDESNSGEPWVQGLVEGEYSDLSVEERLNALVALIGVANEGNSIRVVLEDRLEAANALKKQMWAEVQLDKRRMKEDFVMKMQYSSFMSDKSEPNIQFSSAEGRQSPLPAVDDKMFWHQQILIFVELRDGCWRLIDSEEDFDALLESLDVRGTWCIQKTERLTVDNIKNEVTEMASKPDCSASTDSPTSTCCVSNSDLPEPSSSFAIGLGRNETEKKDAIKRYQDLEKWMWEECLNSSVLHANKFGKKRCKQLLDICDYCLDLYLSEDNYCPSCHRTSETSMEDNIFSEHVAQWRKKFEGDGLTLQGLYSSSLLRIRLLKLLMALIEATEAIQPDWSESYRKSWGTKLHAALSAEDLLQILTLLEGAIKKDFLSSNFETTNELLGYCKRTESAANLSLNPEMIAVLPWIPQTSSAVALRLMELDASISYMLHQKVDCYKDKGAGDFFALSSKFALAKSIPEDDLTEAPHEAENLLQEPWIDHGSVRSSSGRGRGGRGRGRGRTRGGRSQRRSVSSRSVAAPRGTTTNNERFEQLLGWKGRSRGRGGRKRSRRTARSRQKPVRRVADIGSERDQQKEIFFDNTVRSLDPQWNREETMEIQVEAAENASSSERSEYDDYNGLAAGDEYDDLLPNEYSSVFNGKSDHLIPGVDYNVDGEEDDDDRVAGDDDVDDEEEDDSEQDEQVDTDVERYINSDSDDEGNQDGGEQIGNPDEATGSTSSGFSD